MVGLLIEGTLGPFHRLLSSYCCTSNKCYSGCLCRLHMSALTLSESLVLSEWEKRTHPVTVLDETRLNLPVSGPEANEQVDIHILMLCLRVTVCMLHV